MSAVEGSRRRGRPYDPAERARLNGYARSAKAGSVIVSLYREP